MRRTEWSLRRRQPVRRPVAGPLSRYNKASGIIRRLPPAVDLLERRTDEERRLRKSGDRGRAEAGEERRLGKSGGRVGEVGGGALGEKCFAVLSKNVLVGIVISRSVITNSQMMFSKTICLTPSLHLLWKFLEPHSSQFIALITWA